MGDTCLDAPHRWCRRAAAASVDVPEGTLTLLWRGTLEIEDKYHLKVKHLLVAEEPVGEPKSSEAYAAIFHDKLADKRALEERAEQKEREEKIAQMDTEGRANVRKALKEGGAPQDLIAEVEKQETVEKAQSVMLEWVEKNFGPIEPPMG